jgi:phosphate uptake regulator
MVRYARRLQQIGSSILISLPSQWIKDNNLKKGDTIQLDINRDNTISIFPSNDEATNTKDVTIHYSPASMDSLVNQVYGAYLLGYDLIRVKADGSISYEDAERFKRAMRKLVGLEIVEEDRQIISSQFLLDPNTLDAEKILRRMNSLVGGMFRESLEAIRERENIIRRSIGGRDDEVDRQYFLLVRLIRSAMMDQQLAGKLNLSNIDILDYRIAANLLESAGDFMVDLASLQDFTKLALVDRFVQAGELVEKMQEKAVAAFAGKNRVESVEVASMYNKFNEIMNSIKETSAGASNNKSPESTVAVLNLTYSLDRIARCWVDIADLVKPVHLIAPLRNA